MHAEIFGIDAEKSLWIFFCYLYASYPVTTDPFPFQSFTAADVLAEITEEETRMEKEMKAMREVSRIVSKGEFMGLCLILQGGKGRGPEPVESSHTIQHEIVTRFSTFKITAY